MAQNIVQWLENVGLSKLAPVMAEHDIDLDILPDLTEEDLQSLGLSFGDRKRLLKAIDNLSQAPTEESAPAALPDHGERRQVTVLFADLAGFTELSNQLDPEETHKLLTRYFDKVDKVVQDFGGRVDKHIGDAVMAVFGAPVAHSNDAERAVRTAEEIHKAVASLSPPQQVHIGVASGQVLASKTGSDTHVEYTVTGTSVNLASRLEGLAKPGETLLSDAVYQSISHLTDCEALGDTNVRGLNKPVPVWRLTDLHPALDEIDHRPFVGRHNEENQFRGALQSCLDNGAGGAFYIRGDAGIGKTRLAGRFQDIAIQKGFTCHHALILDFGAGQGEGATASLVRSLLDHPQDGDIRQSLKDAMKDGAVSADGAMHLYALLNQPQPDDLRQTYEALDTSARRRGERAAITTLLKAKAAQQPQLLRIEDIHWAEPNELEQLATLINVTRESPVLVIVTSRFEGDPLDRAWYSAVRGCQFSTLDLGPLRPEEARTLANEYLDSASGFAQRCINRAAGNPLFLEQLLHSSEESEIPGSVQSIVQSRLDSLSTEDKHALQAASVLGQRFSLPALRQLTQQPDFDCRNLLAHYLIQPEGEDYLFAHALIRDGVYQSLLHEERKSLHLAAARWFADRDLGLKAEHLEQAGDPGAAEAYLTAAAELSENYKLDSAKRLIGRGLELAQEPETRFKLGCLNGKVLRELGDIGGSISAFESAVALAQDDTQRIRAWIGQAAGLRFADRLDEAFSVIDHAIAGAEEHGLDAELAEAHFIKGNLFFPLNKLEDCLTEHRKAYDIARRAGSVLLEARALGGLGDANYLYGRMATANDYFKRCVALCRQHGFRRIEAANVPMIAWTLIFMGERHKAAEVAEEACELTRSISHDRAEIIALGVQAEIAIVAEDAQALHEIHTRHRELCDRIRALRFIGNNLSYKAHALTLEGRIEEGRDVLDRAIAESRKFTRFSGPWVQSLLLYCYRDREEAEAAIARCEEMLEAGAVAHNHLFFYKDAIKYCLREGDPARARHYAEALLRYTADEPLGWSKIYAEAGLKIADYLEDKDQAEQALSAFAQEVREKGFTDLSNLIDKLTGGQSVAAS